MSPHFPVMSGREMMALLRREGFVQVSQKGSHVKMQQHVNGRVVIIPNHRELAQGTLRSILRQAGLSEDDFYNLLD